MKIVSSAFLKPLGANIWQFFFSLFKIFFFIPFYPAIFHPLHHEDLYEWNEELKSRGESSFKEAKASNFLFSLPLRSRDCFGTAISVSRVFRYLASVQDKRQISRKYFVSRWFVGEAAVPSFFRLSSGSMMLEYFHELLSVKTIVRVKFSLCFDFFSFSLNSFQRKAARFFFSSPS